MDLKANAHVISKLDLTEAGEEISSQLAGDGLRITLVDKDGDVIYDSMQDEGGKWKITKDVRKSSGRLQSVKDAVCGDL